MVLSFIVAIAEDNAIGIGNNLPWHLPEDMKFFKRTTMGKPVLMGRKTYESLGKPLPGRLNIVITSDSNLPVGEGVLIYNSLEEGIKRLQEEKNEEGFIIGGGKIFEAAWPFADRMYITRVHTIVPDATAFFPEIDHTHWRVVSADDHHRDEKHKYDFTFEHYERINL